MRSYENTHKACKFFISKRVHNLARILEWKIQLPMKKKDSILTWSDWGLIIFLFDNEGFSLRGPKMTGTTTGLEKCSGNVFVHRRSINCFRNFLYVLLKLPSCQLCVRFIVMIAICIEEARKSRRIRSKEIQDVNR